LAKVLFKKLLRSDLENWSQYLPQTQYGLNSRTSRRTKSTPFALFYAREAVPFEGAEVVVAAQEPWEKNRWEVAVQDVFDRMVVMDRIVYMAIANITEDYAQKTIKQTNKKRKFRQFRVGD